MTEPSDTSDSGIVSYIGLLRTGDKLTVLSDNLEILPLHHDYPPACLSTHIYVFARYDTRFRSRSTSKYVLLVWREDDIRFRIVRCKVKCNAQRLLELADIPDCCT